MSARNMLFVLANIWHIAAAVMREDAVAGLVGPRDHDGQWDIVPEFPDANTFAMEDPTVMPQSLSTTSIGPAIGEIKAKYKHVCATLKSSMEGGLSNTMGVINAPMEYSMQRNLTWIMPAILPPAHGVSDDFAHLFGQPAVAEGCEERTVPLWEADCVKNHEEHHSDSHAPFGNWVGYRCRPYETEFQDTAPDLRNVTLCGCDAIVQFGTTNYHYDYHVTGPVMSDLYWKHTKMPDFSFPLATVHHVRLGDVEYLNRVDKFVNGTKMATMVNAFAEASHIDAKCLKVTVVTDGNRDDEHVLMTTQAWKHMGVSSVDVLDNRDPATKAFEMMTRSGILVGGTSGFPRFAAVLSKSRVKLFYDDPWSSHPLQYLEGVISVPDPSTKEEIKKAIAENDAWKAVAHDCDQWLRKTMRGRQLSTTVTSG